MLTLDNHFIGTYGKNLLTDWSVIADLIKLRGMWIKETLETAETSSPENALLSDQKINDALNGPYQQFFKAHLAAYAKIAKLETAITLSKEDYFKESEHNADLTLGLPTFLIERNDFSVLKNLRDQLNTLVKTHYTQWDTKDEEWKALIIAELKIIELQIADSEMQDLTVNQPLSELNDRFINLKLNLPRLSKSAFDFQQYWTLKAAIAIQSALGRMHLPNSDKEIDDKLKLLKPAFKKITSAENTLITAQKTAIQKLLMPITPPGGK
ncbi:MAG: hypothetical protein Q8L78_03660 [Coxiellaceae bacterium]|nr:hypothetical protein [Coxiellaceae bacterium]